MEEEAEDNWAPLYEPTEFNEAHKPLMVEQYKLPKEDLLTWAERCISIRTAIVDKSKLFLEEEPNIEVSIDRSRGRRGYRKSTAEQNIEGLQEQELKR